jgi:predicted transcriptional regulator
LRNPLKASAAVSVFLVVAMTRQARTRPDRLLEHPVRLQIWDFLIGGTGARFTPIWKATGVSRTTIRHHLILMQRAGIVEGIGARAFTYFPNGHSHDAEAKRVLERRRVYEVAAMIHQHPGITQQEIVDPLVMQRKVFREIADLLKAHDMIREERQGNRPRYHPLPRLKRCFPSGSAQADGNGGSNA